MGAKCRDCWVGLIVNAKMSLGLAHGVLFLCEAIMMTSRGAFETGALEVTYIGKEFCHNLLIEAIYGCPLPGRQRCSLTATKTSNHQQRSDA